MNSNPDSSISTCVAMAISLKTSCNRVHLGTSIIEYRKGFGIEIASL